MTSNPTSNSFILIIVIPKNALGNMSDIAWKHCISIAGDIRKLQCKYYQKVITRGVYQLKASLGWY